MWSPCGCHKSLLIVSPPTTLLHQAVSMSNKVFCHQVPVLPRRGFRHIAIDRKKKSRSSQVVHTTVTNSPRPRRIATPVPATPSTSQVDASGHDQNHVNEESIPLRFGKVGSGIINNLHWLISPSHKMISFGSRQPKCLYGCKI